MGMGMVFFLVMGLSLSLQELSRMILDGPSPDRLAAAACFGAVDLGSGWPLCSLDFKEMDESQALLVGLGTGWVILRYGKRRSTIAK